MIVDAVRCCIELRAGRAGGRANRGNHRLHPPRRKTKRRLGPIDLPRPQSRPRPAQGSAGKIRDAAIYLRAQSHAKSGWKKGNPVGKYYYVRPVGHHRADRHPLRASCQYGIWLSQLKGLEEELAKEPYRSATVFMAWEHGLLDDFVKSMVKDYGGDPEQVPAWPGPDFDTIFFLKVTRDGARRRSLSPSTTRT